MWIYFYKVTELCGVLDSLFTGKSDEMVLFADNTSIIFKIDRNQNSCDKVNTTLSLIMDWFTVNNLLLNTEKTKCIRFSLSNMGRPGSMLIWLCVGNPLIMWILRNFWAWHWSSSCKRVLILGLWQVSLFLRLLLSKKLGNWRMSIRLALVYYSYFHSVMSYGNILISVNFENYWSIIRKQVPSPCLCLSEHLQSSNLQNPGSQKPTPPTSHLINFSFSSVI